MAEISKITLPSGTTYDLKDATARSSIETLKATVAGGVQYVGATTTALSDGATTKTVSIKSGDSSTDHTAAVGDMVDYNNVLYIFNKNSQWDQLGSAGALKALAYKDSASTSYQPAGSISQPSWTGTAATISVSGTPKGSVTVSGKTAGSDETANYTPAGSISKPSWTGTAATITVSGTPKGSVTIGTGTGTANYTPAGSVTVTPSVTMNTTTVNSITAVGSLPSWSGTVSGETLTIGWSAGTLPTKGTNTTVATGVKSATATGSFSGTGVQLTGSFTGSSSSATGSYTPAGSVGTPTFTGSGAVLSGSFSGSSLTSTGSYTPAGSVGTPTFTGSSTTITVK